MTPEFEIELNRKLAAYDKWASENEFSKCRLVQYCGVDFIGAIDVKLNQIVHQITGLLCEGFNVDWNLHNDSVYLRVYEYGPEPTWDQTIKEEPLAGIAVILKEAGFDE